MAAQRPTVRNMSAWYAASGAAVRVPRVDCWRSIDLPRLPRVDTSTPMRALTAAVVIALSAPPLCARAGFEVESPIPWPDTYSTGPLRIVGFWGTSPDH